MNALRAVSPFDPGKEAHHATKRLHAHRASGCYRDYRHTRGDPFPVFAQAREKARQTTCVSNVRQLALGLVLYVQDYDETFPIQFNTGPVLPPDQVFFGQQPNIWTWQNHAMVYVKNYQVHACPSGWSERSTWSGRRHRANGGYGANDQVIAYGRPGADNVPYAVCTLAQVEAPAETYMILESGNYSADCRDFQESRYPANYLPGARWNERCFNSPRTNALDTRTCRGATRAQAQAYWGAVPGIEPKSDIVRDALDGRHNRRLVIAFADGHVKNEDPDRALFNVDSWFRPVKGGCVRRPPAY